MSQTLSSLAKGSTPDDLLEKAMKKIKVEHAWRVGELSFQLKENIKELRFHPYYREMLITTAEDSYNVFRPNLEPEEEEEDYHAKRKVNPYSR
jgi:hypothetical protein